MREFFTCMFDLLRQWSLERNPMNIDAKLFYEEPIISNDLMSKSYIWAKEVKGLKYKTLDDESVQYIVGAANSKLTTDQIEKKH